MTLTRQTFQPLVSVIVNNYNYGRFLAQAVDSALSQEYPHLEVIVVDDGSTDDSRETIARYGSKITPVLKANGGQASAFNAGFNASRGEAVIFLDSDDQLAPSAVSAAVGFFAEPGVSKVHWPLWIVDVQGQRSGGIRPGQAPPEGDFRQEVLERGPSNVSSSPTSGNMWARWFLERVLPAPEDVPYYRLCADEYLYTLAPVFGKVKCLATPQGYYRIHGANVYSSRSFRDKADLELAGYEQQCRALQAALERNGIRVDTDSWKRHSWFHRLDRAVHDVISATPDGSRLVLVDGAAWDAAEGLGRRVVRPFLECDGLDWGFPADDQAAVARLAELPREGSQFFVLAWSCFWWFDEYPRFFQHLERAARCVVRNDAVAVFELLEAPHG